MRRTANSFCILFPASTWAQMTGASFSVPFFRLSVGTGDRGKLVCALKPRCGALHTRFDDYTPRNEINYYPCQGQSALSMPNFNEASLSDTLQLVYSYKILWETGSLIPFYIGHYYNNQSSHQWLLLLRNKLPISLI